MFRLLGSLIMGALVGWIAGHLMDAKGGLLRNIVVGVIGSFVGSFVCAFLGFYAYGFIATLVVNVVGACLFIWLGRRQILLLNSAETIPDRRSIPHQRICPGCPNALHQLLPAKKTAFPGISQRRRHKTALPLHFISFSQRRPHWVLFTPFRCNRRSCHRLAVP